MTECPVLQSCLNFQRNSKRTYDRPLSHFRHGNYHSNSLCNVIYTQQRYFRGTVCRYNNMEVREVFRNILVFMVIINPLSSNNYNLPQWPHTLHPIGKSVFLFTFCIILDGIHIHFKVMFPIYGIRLTIFWSMVEQLS